MPSSVEQPMVSLGEARLKIGLFRLLGAGLVSEAVIFNAEAIASGNVGLRLGLIDTALVFGGLVLLPIEREATRELEQANQKLGNPQETGQQG